MTNNGPRQTEEATANQRELDRVLDAIGPLDSAAMAATAAGLDRLTKPPGSLGRLETLTIELAGITGRPDAPVDHRTIVVAAADHGVVRQGISAYPSDVTAQMVANFVAGGAAINVLAVWAGINLLVVDAGVATEIPEAPGDPARGGRLVRARIRDGTADMSDGPAMTRDEALRAVITGIDLASRLWTDGLDLIGVGEMGIGNTTAASAITAVITGQPVADVTGRGTGIDDETHRRKIATIERAIAVNRPDPRDPVGVLAAVGGLEIAVLVGAIVGAAAVSVPVVLDGFITGSAALIAGALQPAIVPRLIAAHRSAEPGHAAILEWLGRPALLDLDLRLGEGTGAALAMGLITAAVRIRDEMATFESAAVSGPSTAESLPSRS
ncbi:MAG: nicotinate-nucleotide--dimethylbenzimidazole phosphoribosyltransferase [Chloroflexota bacterium]